MDGRDYLEVLESLARTRSEKHDPLAHGDDSTPLADTVLDPPPSHWGTLTSTSRTASDAYMKFLGKKP